MLSSGPLCSYTRHAALNSDRIDIMASIIHHFPAKKIKKSPGLLEASQVGYLGLSNINFRSKLFTNQYSIILFCLIFRGYFETCRSACAVVHVHIFQCHNNITSCWKRCWGRSYTLLMHGTNTLSLTISASPMCHTPTWYSKKVHMPTFLHHQEQHQVKMVMQSICEQFFR